MEVKQICSVFCMLRLKSLHRFAYLFFGGVRDEKFKKFTKLATKIFVRFSEKLPLPSWKWKICCVSDFGRAISWFRRVKGASIILGAWVRRHVSIFLFWARGRFGRVISQITKLFDVNVHAFFTRKLEFGIIIII